MIALKVRSWTGILGSRPSSLFLVALQGAPRRLGAWVAIHPFLPPDDLGANHVVDVDTSSQEDGW